MPDPAKYWEEPFNFVRGCTPVSNACRRCYARRNHNRLLANPQVASYCRPFEEVYVVEEMLEDPQPLRWRRPRVVFVNNLSDTFHAEVPDAAIHRAFEIMSEAEDHTFLVLTKRSERMKQFAWDALGGLWPENVWAGVTVESWECEWRWDDLLDTPARMKFVSYEPAIKPLKAVDNRWKMRGIDWLIAGGETGAGSGVMSKAEARRVRDACQRWEVKFWLKQWGGTAGPPKDAAILDGRRWTERPATSADVA